MKKCFLFLAIIIAAFTYANAQRILSKSQLKTAVHPLFDTKVEPNNTHIARISPDKDSVVYSTDNVNSILIGESSNYYGYFDHAQRQISLVPTGGINGNSIAFVFRQNWQNCGTSSSESGKIRYNLSTNGGQTWAGYNFSCLGRGPLNPAYTYEARYPNALLFSDGDTSLNGLNIAYVAPVILGTTWSGCVFGAANNVTNTFGATVNQEEYDSTTVNGLYRPENIAIGGDGSFWSAVVTSANLLEIWKGGFDTATHSINWAVFQTINLNPYLSSTNFLGFASEPVISFSAVSQKGYIVMSGDIIGGWDNCVNPIICEYNTSTGFFDLPYELSFNNFSAITDHISSYLDPSGAIISNKATMINPSITVDSRGELHILALTVPANNSGSFYTDFGVDLYDMTKDTTGNWAAIHIDSIAVMRDTLGTGGQTVSYFTFPNISRSNDGKYLMYSWDDTDTTGMGSNVVAAANLKGCIYDVLQDKISPITNWTSNDVNWNGIVKMPKASEVVIDHFNCIFRVPTTVIKNPTLNTAEFYYFSNIEYTCSQAINTPQWVKNCTLFPLSVNPTVTNPSCTATSTNGSINLNMTGGVYPYTYLVHNFLYNTVDTASFPFVANLAAGIYQISVIDDWGCEIQTQVINLNQGNAPVISIQGNNPICAGALTCLNVVPVTTGCSYNWSNGAIGSTTCYTAGTCMVQENCGGCLGYAMTTITAPDSIIINAQVANVNCVGGMSGSIITTVTGGTAPYSYQWSGNSVLSVPSLYNIGIGTYTLTITDANGCIGQKTFTISVQNPITINAQVINAICGSNTNGSITTTVTGGAAPYSYLWSGSASATTPNLNNISAGTYNVAVTDIHGCVGNASFNVGTQNGFSVAFQTINVSCFGGSNGHIITNVTGGTPPYLYQWLNASPTNSPTLINLFSGIYYLTVTDANGCVVNTSDTVFSPFSIYINPQAINPSCIGNSDGSIAINVTGGTPPYSYQWSGGSTASTPNLINLSSGTYSLSVIDSNGCYANKNIILNNPSPLNLILNQLNPFITTNVTGGTTPYTYSWTGPACFTPPTTSVSSILTNCPTCSGTFTCFLTDANGCTATASSVCVVSIDKEIGLTSFSLIPNPTSKTTVLSLAFEKSKNVSISIINVHGQSIFEKEIGNVLRVEEEIKVKDWAKGVYYVKISTDNGIITRKLVIN